MVQHGAEDHERRQQRQLDREQRAQGVSAPGVAGVAEPRTGEHRPEERDDRHGVRQRRRELGLPEVDPEAGGVAAQVRGKSPKSVRKPTASTNPPIDPSVIATEGRDASGGRATRAT